jgi:FkbH-like protein
VPKLLLTGDMNISGLARALRNELTAPTWTVSESGYNSWFLEVTDPASALVREAPQFLVVFLSPRVLADFPDLEAQLVNYLDLLKGKAGAARVLFSSFVAYPFKSQMPFESIEEQKLAARLNRRLWDFQNDHSWFTVLDFSAFVAAHGVAQIHDERYESLGRLFLSPKGSELFARFIQRAVTALLHPPKKVLVLDLDNTLWGGILGEEGAEGIQCGGDGTGYAFLRFHQALLRIKSNGVLLAICSKNNEADVVAAFRDHPDFVLRLKDFAAHRINWEPKIENLKSLAAELNLGLDSFVFFDDSEFERELVKQALPMIDVIPVPAEPSYYVKALADYPGFDIVRVTDEDRSRSRLYLDEAERRSLQKQSTSLEDFYAFLDMRAEIRQVDESDFARVHQLIQKTNQFNLTSKRYAENELRTLLKDPRYSVYTLRLSDRLGESGLTGLAVVRRDDKVWEIVNLLLSCRIIGRTVEFGFMRFLTAKAKAAGAAEVMARFIPSPRNQVAKNYLADAGFQLVAGNVEKWNLRVDEAEARLPRSFVRITEK